MARAHGVRVYCSYVLQLVHLCAGALARPNRDAHAAAMLDVLTRGRGPGTPQISP